MAQLTQWLNAVNALVWGIPMVVLILGTGLYLQLRLGLLPLRKIGYGFRMIWQSRRVKEGQAGDISPYAALMTALSATVGTGNIAGVATAIALGRATMRNIRQNLVFAFVYNAAGIPVAAGVLYPTFGLLLSPTLAAAAMALSSVSVIGNALRLRAARLD